MIPFEELGVDGPETALVEGCTFKGPSFFTTAFFDSDFFVSFLLVVAGKVGSEVEASESSGRRRGRPRFGVAAGSAAGSSSEVFSVFTSAADNFSEGDFGFLPRFCPPLKVGVFLLLTIFAGVLLDTAASFPLALLFFAGDALFFFKGDFFTGVIALLAALFTGCKGTAAAGLIL